MKTILIWINILLEEPMACISIGVIIFICLLFLIDYFQRRSNRRLWEHNPEEVAGAIVHYIKEELRKEFKDVKLKDYQLDYVMVRVHELYGRLGRTLQFGDVRYLRDELTLRFIEAIREEQNEKKRN